MAETVFISHSSKDREFARTICTALEGRGLTCWLASRDVGPGENFMDAIVRAIRAAKVMVLVFSENANNSDEIKREIVLAGNAKLTVIPVRIEEVVPKDAFAYQFATRQWIDLFDDWESQLERLAKWINSIISTGIVPTDAQAATLDAPLIAPDISKASEDEARHSKQRSDPGPAFPSNRAGPDNSSRVSRRRILIGGAAAAVAIGGGALSYRLLQARNPIRTFGSGGGVTAVAISPDGRLGLSGDYEGNVNLWDIATGNRIDTLTGHSSRVCSVAFSPDRRTALSGSDDKTMKLWYLQPSELIRDFGGNAGVIRSVTFSPDGHTALTANHDEGALKLWNVATGAVIRTFSEKAPYSAVFSPDGRIALAGGEVGVLGIWDIATGAQALKMIATPSTIYTVAITPDGRAALSGGEDKAVTLWDTARGFAIRTLNGHTREVNSAIFTPDGLTVLSGSSDKTLRVWDPANGDTIGILTGHSEAVNSVAIAPDGRTALSGSDDGTLKLWDMTWALPGERRKES